MQCDRQMNRQRVRQRADGATGIAPAIPDTRRPPFVLSTGDGKWQRRSRHPLFFESTGENFALPKQWYAGHRIRCARWPPDFPLGIAGDAALFLHLVIISSNIVVGDRPVRAFVVQRPGLKIFFMQARPHGIVMHRAAANAVSRIKNIADGIFAVLDNRGAAPFQSPCPDCRADQVIVAALRPRFEDDHLLAANGQLCRDRTAGGTRTDDNRIDFFVWHSHSPHLLGGSMCAM